MSFVFISHASPDKQKIRHIVKALVKSGLKVWLDNPTSADLGFSKPYIKANFYRSRIRAGGKGWENEIIKALNEASCVLVCWSSRAVTKRALNRKERAIWFDEAAYAYTSGKLVACMIDQFNPGDLPGTIAMRQMPMVGRKKKDHVALELLISDIRRKLSEQNQTGFAKKAPLSNLPAYYFVDRIDQERPIAIGLKKLIDHGGGVQAFFIGGPDNECVDRFIDRLHYDMSSKQIGDGRTWDQIRVDWPDDDTDQAFKDHYCYALSDALQLPCTASLRDIAESLAWRGVPVAILSQILASDWQHNEQIRIKAWLSLWKEIAAQASSFIALPILSVKMPQTTSKWYPKLSCPRINAGRVNTKNIWRIVQDLKSDEELATFFSAPPLLHPVKRKHVNDWRGSTLEKVSLDRDAMTKCLNDLFQKRWWQRGEPTVPLRCFADKMKPLFDKGAMEKTSE